MMSVVSRLLQVVRRKMSLWLIIFFLLSFIVSVDAVRITTDTKFVVGNATYKVYQTMDFHTIIIADSYIVFNSTGFYVSSGNAITVTLSYLNSNIAGAGDGDKVLEFYADTTGGFVSFVLSGFLSGNSYDVKRDGAKIASVIADGSGLISFNNSAWSTRLFSVYKNGSAPSDTTSPEISTVALDTSTVLDTEAGFGWENISCTVTDNVGVETVCLLLTCPNGSVLNISMVNNVGTSTYYYHTTLSIYGNYSYCVWACDFSGNGQFSGSSLFSKPPNWDVNNDGRCTVFDLVLISNHYSETGTLGWIREDVDNNGVIEVLDFVLASNNYGIYWWS